MYSDDETMSFSDTEAPSSPIAPKKTLKRLRKVNTDQIPNSSASDDLQIENPHSPRLEELREMSQPETEDNFDERVEELEKEVSVSEGFEVSKEKESGDEEVEGGFEVDHMEDEEEMEGNDSVELKTLKKEKKKKRRKISTSSDGFDEIPFAYASSKKERRNRLKELHAESQRLLRETCDASFKPAPVVHKPIYSVLEKIRKRKLEVSRKFVVAKSSNMEEDECSSEEVEGDFDAEEIHVEHKKDGKVTKSDVGAVDHPGEPGCSVGTPIAEGSAGLVDQSKENKTPEVDSSEEMKEKFRAPVDDTQDLMIDSQTSESSDELPDGSPSRPLEEILAPSVLAMNLKFDSALGDDSPLDEEDNDKEHVDPGLIGSDQLSLSARGDPVKAFVDEEAEEEDDSDNDHGRFQDEEDDDTVDDEEINAIIATGYEEKPVDKDMRNQLHQKWLEQQDAAGMENLLQRLNCGSSKPRETVLLEEQEEEEEEEEEDSENDEDEECASDGGDDPSALKNLVKMNLKKAKEMIHLMFTDNDDAYVSSDDEETRGRPSLHNILDKPDEEVPFTSKNEEGSRDIFSLIKRLNSVPDTKKKAKAPSRSFVLPAVGDANMSLKSSFLRRMSGNSFPSSKKLGPTKRSKTRAFVFGRDDSNNRSMESMAAVVPDMGCKEDQPRKYAHAKFSNSQARSNTQTQSEKMESVTKTGPSLHEILRSSSVQSSNTTRNSTAGQMEAIYAAFKVDMNQTKRQSGLSVRAT